MYVAAIRFLSESMYDDWLKINISIAPHNFVIKMMKSTSGVLNKDISAGFQKHITNTW